MFLGGMKKTGAVFRPQIWEKFRSWIWEEIFPVFLLFFVYFDVLLKVIFVSSMKVFLGSGFGKYGVLRF